MEFVDARDLERRDGFGQFAGIEHLVHRIRAVPAYENDGLSVSETVRRANMIRKTLDDIENGIVHAPTVVVVVVIVAASGQLSSYFLVQCFHDLKERCRALFKLFSM